MLPLGFLVVAAGGPALAGAWYLPGVSPVAYTNGAEVTIRANKLTSAKTQLPFDYFDAPFCKPAVMNSKVENLGEILKGDRIHDTKYALQMMVPMECTAICSQDLSDEDFERLRWMIDEEYLVNLLVDNLPAGTRYVVDRPDGNQEELAMVGFPVGAIASSGKYFVYNHLSFVVSYHKNAKDAAGHRIVGLEVTPFSQPSCGGGSGKMFLEDAEDKGRPVVFSYSVTWTESDVEWASRWDVYLKVRDVQIHWFSVANSFLIVMFLSAMLAMILLRTVFRDITAYNEVVTTEDIREESGWKLVHGDVFRKPFSATLMSASVGVGLQLNAGLVMTLLIALCGLLSPSRRGALTLSLLLLICLAGIVAGFVAAICVRTLYGEGHQEASRRTVLVTSLFYPGVLLLIFLAINVVLAVEGSTEALSFSTEMVLLLLWGGVSVPLVYVGYHVGAKRPAIALPVETNRVPRRIPEGEPHGSTFVVCAIGGLLPFGAAFTEILTIMGSVWNHQFYYMFGFLALTYMMWCVVCIETAVAAVYYQLTCEDYHWWWRAFLVPASSAVYFFIYSIVFMVMRLQIDWLGSIVIYLGFNIMIALVLVLVSGSLGLIGSFFFVRAIYGAVKVD